MPRFSIFVCLFLCLYRPHAQELSIEHSVKVEFPTQAGYDYTVYSTTDPNQQSGWKPLGSSVTRPEKSHFFYQRPRIKRSSSRLANPPQCSTCSPNLKYSAITGLPPGTIPGIYDLGQLWAKIPQEVPTEWWFPGTFDYVILLPHPSNAIGLLPVESLSRRTGLGSGQVILRVPTTDGSSYEPLKMVDNGSQSIVEGL